MILLSKSNNLNDKGFRSAVVNLFKLNNSYKEFDAKYNEKKKHYTNEINKYFEQNKINKNASLIVGDSNLCVNKVQKASISFDAEKLEKALDKDISEDIIVKQYYINDFKSLVKYLKSCNVDPRKFKKFISVEKSVNTNELERLEALGVIELDEIKGCYEVKKHNPYFMIKVKKDDANEERTQRRE